MVGKPNFSDLFKRTIRYKNVGYNTVIMRQYVCLVVNPITVYNYRFIFECAIFGQASYSMTALAYSFNQLVSAWYLSFARPTVDKLK